MLGAHGQKLCRNLDVHWVTQTCGPHNETGTTYVFCWHVTVSSARHYYRHRHRHLFALKCVRSVKVKGKGKGKGKGTGKVKGKG